MLNRQAGFKAAHVCFILAAFGITVFCFDPLWAAEAAGNVGGEEEKLPSMWMKIFDTSSWSNFLPISALFCCSVVGIAAIINRFFGLSRSKILDDSLVESTEKLLRSGDVKGAIQNCRNSNTLDGQVMAGAIEDVLVRGETKEIAFGENTILRTEPLGAWIEVLNTCGRIAPLMGLLGTVIGMIEAFTIIAAYEEPPKHLVAQGIGTALLTTALGLIIAIPCVIGESYFQKRAEHFFNEIQERLAIIRAALPSKASVVAEPESTPGAGAVVADAKAAVPETSPVA